MSKIDVMVCTSASYIAGFHKPGAIRAREPHRFMEDLGDDILSHVLHLIELHLVVFLGTCETQ